MKSPCLYCRQSCWARDPNDYTLPVFVSCKKGLTPEANGKECAGLDLFHKSVIDLIDDDGFEKAKAERWKYIRPHLYYCTLHNTHFDPDGYAENDFQDAEPCWACYDEFRIQL